MGTVDGCGCAKVIAAVRTMPLIHVYDEAGNVIETHEYAGDFKEW
jgi:hypothetical protein